jgi:hypothetical protein
MASILSRKPLVALGFIARLQEPILPDVNEPLDENDVPVCWYFFRVAQAWSGLLAPFNIVEKYS